MDDQEGVRGVGSGASQEVVTDGLALGSKSVTNVVTDQVGDPVTSMVTNGSLPGSESVTSQKLQLSMDGQAKPAGRFEMLAITVGQGNGWNFTAEVLQKSLALWDGAEVFVDHGSFFSMGRSVRDLAGVVHSASWDSEHQGVKLELRCTGPSGKLLEEVGRDWLATPAAQRPRLGFSADLFMTTKGREVQEVLRINSVDLVFKPARGGAFLRALNSQLTGGAETMDKNDSNTVETQLSGDLAAVRDLMQVQREQAALAAEAEKARAVRAEMCGLLLESGLAASKLPQAMQASIKARFSGQVFEPAELTQAIDEGRKLTAELQAGSVIAGPRVHGMLSSEDRLQAAVDDLLDAPREQGMEGKKVEQLRGIRELYTMMTGDVDLHGGYHPEHVQLSTTTTMAGLVKNALNKSMVKQWEELGRAGYKWWEKIVTVEHFNSLNDITGILVGEATLLPAVAEADPYVELKIDDSPEVGTFTKYGGYLPLTLELIDRDNVTKLKLYPKKLAVSSLRRISALVAEVFTANAGVGPAMADGHNVFDAVNHKNLLTTALASAAWEAASAAIYNQDLLVAAGDTAPKLGVDAKYCIVPRALRLTAMQVLYPTLERATNITSENMQKGELGDVITCPEFTDATDWAAVADPRIAPAIYVGERFGLMPEIFIAGDETSGAMFTNDDLRIKVRHFVSVFVADHRPLHKSNVAG